MSVEIACTCEGLPAHSHTGKWLFAEKDPTQVRVPAVKWVPDGGIRLWIDWKAVAHDLMVDP